MNKKKAKGRALGVIPARYRASRFPGKLLALLGGKTVIERVYRRAKSARRLDRVLVATDDRRIFRAVESFGGEAVMTSPAARSGTDRIAEACSRNGLLDDFEVVVNIQGDEPFIRKEMIDPVVEELFRSPEVPVVSLKKRIHRRSEIDDPDTVKVVTDKDGYALYFSRLPVPYSVSGRRSAPVFKHVGLYGYRSSFLPVFATLPAGQAERSEKLEQLRILENGYRIKLLETRWDTVGIDTPRDLEEAARRLSRGSG